MSDVAEFPFPADVTDEERATARREISKHTTIVGEGPDRIRFAGRWIGQTGPIWHLQYTRLYALSRGYLVAAHDLREGITVGFAEEAAKLPECFDDPHVREFIEDELRFRKIIGTTTDAATV